MSTSYAIDRPAGTADGQQGLLFDATVRVLLLAAFLELVLYRLISRLGMHLSKLAAKYEAVRVTFKALSWSGFVLLDFVSMLAFLALGIVLLNKTRSVGCRRFDRILVPAVSLHVMLTVGFLLFPPAMVGTVAHNVLLWVILLVLAVDYLSVPRPWPQRAMLIAYATGISGWLYYQVVSTTYGLLGLLDAPPLAHEVNRFGEAMMVLASLLVFWAYAGFSFRTTNRRQQRRTVVFAGASCGAFVLLLFVDSLAGWYDPALAESLRKAGEGIGWIFQMGMGYTFYLPFALYMAGLLGWSYTVIKLLTMGRYEGIGIGLMFMAGYALNLSHLSWMVILGMILLTLERRRPVLQADSRAETPALEGGPQPLLGQRA
jgi:hypothetical protein